MKAWGRLLRLSLAPTAAADVAAGAVAGAGAWPAGSVFLLMLASLAVYHGGMALNDWADRGEDRALRPDRPIPSGAVRPAAALAAGLALLLLGPAIACAVSRTSAAVLLGVSVIACAYDLRLRGPAIGPALLATCRAGNLSAGIVFGAGAALEPRMLAPAAAYGAYVFAVSSLGRLEDAPAAVLASARPSAQLTFAGLILAASPLAGLASRSTESASLLAALVLALAGSAGLFARARRKAPPWSGPEVTRATGLGLRRLLVFTAALSVATGGREGAIVAAAILAGYPVSYVLRGVFPPS
jgi:4-hydroxybenzoate polyprenyltransferase